MGFLKKIFGGDPAEVDAADDEVDVVLSDTPNESTAAADEISQVKIQSPPAPPIPPAPPAPPRLANPIAPPKVPAITESKAPTPPRVRPALDRSLTTSEWPTSVAPPNKIAARKGAAESSGENANDVPASQVGKAFPRGAARSKGQSDGAGSNGSLPSRPTPKRDLAPPPPSRRFDNGEKPKLGTKVSPSKDKPSVGVQNEAPKPPPEYPTQAAGLLGAFFAGLCQTEVSAHWIAPIKRATKALRNVSVERSDTSVDEALAKLEGCLEGTAQTGQLSAAKREELLNLSDELGQALPASILPRAKHDRLRDCVMTQLFAQLESVNALTHKKLSAAGFSTFSDFVGVSADTLCERAGLRPEQATAISGVFRDHVERLRTRGPENLESGAEQLIRREIDALEKLVADYEAACDAEDAEQKRNTRRLRDKQGLSLNLLMAQLGELDFASQLMNCSAEDRVEKLRRFVSEQEG